MLQNPTSYHQHTQHPASLRPFKQFEQTESGYSTNSSEEGSFVPLRGEEGNFVPLRKAHLSFLQNKIDPTMYRDELRTFHTNNSNKDSLRSAENSATYDPFELLMENKFENDKPELHDPSFSIRNFVLGDKDSNSSRTKSVGNLDDVISVTSEQPKLSAFRPFYSGNTPRNRQNMTKAFVPVKGPAVLDFIENELCDLDLNNNRFHQEIQLQEEEPFKLPNFSNLNNNESKFETRLHRRHSDTHECAHEHDGSARLIPCPQEMTSPRYKNSANDRRQFKRNQSYSSYSDVSSIITDSTSSSTGHSETTYSTSSSRYETLVNSSVRLSHFIDSTSPEDLKKFLKLRLNSKNPQFIRALSTLIPETTEGQPTIAHCVRCHKKFNTSDKRSRCYLPHPARMVVIESKDEEGTNFSCKACNTGFRLLQMDFYEEGSNSLLTGHCYSGHHTTDPSSVDFQCLGGAAKTCEENGCVEFYV